MTQGIEPPPAGWLNAHCHLELSFLKARIRPGLPFVDWLAEVVRHKRAASRAQIESATRHELARARESGTTVLLDILSLDATEQPLAESGVPGAILFREIIAFDPQLAESSVLAAITRQTIPHSPFPIPPLPGLSPHAAYTTTAPLLHAAAREAARLGQWLCIHAAETPEESEFMEHGRGPLRDFLAHLLPPDWRAPGLSPVQWLEACGCLGPRTLLVHCNMVSPADIALIAERGCSVVVCPGTHRYFGRGVFPLARLMEAGIPVFLGTDSLASNAELDMGREVELAIELSPGVPREAIRALADASRAGWFGLPTPLAR